MTALVLPIIVPMGTAAIMLLTRKWPALQRWIGLAGAIALLASTAAVFGRVNSGGIQVLQIGGWPAPGTALGVSRDARLRAPRPGRGRFC